MRRNEGVVVLHKSVSRAFNAFAGLTFVAATLSPQVGLAAGLCADNSARVGLEMRVLQSELMVAALTCGQRSDYNAFVTAFKPQIKKHSANLKAFFHQAYGEKATVKLNRMVTRLANQASQRSVTQPTSAFCAQSKMRFAKVLAAAPDQLTRIAHTNPAAGDHGIRTCVEVVEKQASNDVTLSSTN